MLPAHRSSPYDPCEIEVDKIAKGAKAGDLPFEEPTRFTLALNLRTARTLGLVIPPTLLVLAEEVIE
jgi:putative ABC transport system substrate-binding protein